MLALGLKQITQDRNIHGTYTELPSAPTRDEIHIWLKGYDPGPLDGGQFHISVADRSSQQVGISGIN